ncbi:MAG: sel1 repeat family protein [Opitutales bacterium]|nr:sel1 repeat family protein [Opitutales bacterium]
MILAIFATPAALSDDLLPEDYNNIYNMADLIRLARSGDARAQYDLADRYYYGIEVKKDIATARDWYIQSAEQNFVPAQYKLATVYRFDKNLTRPELLRYLYRAASSGDAASQFALAICYYEGIWANWNYSTAVDWFFEAARQGHTRAMLYLGICYTWGFGVEQNYEEALWWFQCSADSGESKAQFYLGEAYRFGRGVNVDLKKAAYYYRQAAEQGDRYARLLLRRLGDRDSPPSE